MQPIEQAILQIFADNAPSIVKVAIVIATVAFIFRLLFYALSRISKWSTPRD